MVIKTKYGIILCSGFRERIITMTSKEMDEFQLQLQMEEKERSKRTSTDPYTYTDNDGTVYEWDQAKHAWFPKIDDDFIAAYQSNYGYDESNSQNADNPSQSSKQGDDAKGDESSKNAGTKRPANEMQVGWFEVADEHNTNVYVSGLPHDITDDEFVELMSKCGLIMKDPANNKLKIKLYRDKSGELKGDGLCCYIKVESVELALKILDGYQYRDQVMHVERAKFQQKGQYDPTKKPKKMKSKEKKKAKEQQQKLLDWRPDMLRGMRYKHEKTVIIKNMFNPDDFKTQPELILEYQNDLREECSKFGTVKKTIIYDHHAEGAASVSFNEAEEADVCIQALNGRWFGGLQLTAETWDGRTRYHTNESSKDESERLQQWEEFLVKDDESEQKT